MAEVRRVGWIDNLERPPQEDDVEDLIKDIQERTGLPADKVLEVVTMVTDYMRRALPDDLVHVIASYLGSAADQATTAADTARSTATTATTAAAGAASSVVGMATGMASQALDMAKDAVTAVTNTGSAEPEIAEPETATSDDDSPAE